MKTRSLQDHYDILYLTTDKGGWKGVIDLVIKQRIEYYCIFNTLHNQEHAVDLVKNIIKIVKVFSYFKISNYDFYALFIACYLHDDYSGAF